MSLLAAAPPWPLPADARPYIAAAGLSASPGIPGGGFDVHIDIRADGRRVSIPAGVGEVILKGSPMGTSGMFTDDGSGVVHVVGGARVTLGQFFTEWGVPFSATQLGGFTSGTRSRLTVTEDGRPAPADPTTLVLRPRAEIAVWFGPTSARPRLPQRYRFS